MSATLLIDNSAWARLAQPGLSEKRSEEIAVQLEAGEIAVCLPFLLEAGYSARSSRQHDEVLDALRVLPYAGVDEGVEERAIDTQRQLARAGHHRLPPVDILIAALADHHGLGILHYDNDYELISATTDLAFESVWLAERGSL